MNTLLDSLKVITDGNHVQLAIYRYEVVEGL